MVRTEPQPPQPGLGCYHIQYSCQVRRAGWAWCCSCRFGTDRTIEHGWSTHVNFVPDDRTSDVVLLAPPTPGFSAAYSAENLGLGYLAATLKREGYRVRILDSVLEELDATQTFQALIGIGEPALLGLSILSPIQYEQAKKLTHALRQHGWRCHITAGGVFATYWYETLLTEQACHSVICFEGEHTILTLVERLKHGQSLDNVPGLAVAGQQNISSVRPILIADLDWLPFPARDYLPLAQKLGLPCTVSASRGCSYGKCQFCSVATFYQVRDRPTYRFRSASLVVSELSDLQTEHGVSFVFFVDDDFLGRGLTETGRLVSEIQARKLNLNFAINCRADDVQFDLFSRLRDAGLVAAYIGIESGAQSVLDRYHKGGSADRNLQAAEILGDLDIKLIPSIILFDAFTTLEELKDNIGFLRRLGGFHITYLKMIDPMRGTVLVDVLQQRGLLRQFGTGYKYISKDPRVELLRRMITTDYRPMTADLLNLVYPLWYWMLERSSSKEALLKARVEGVVQDILNQDLFFLEQTIRCIEAGDFSSYYCILADIEAEFECIRGELEVVHRRVTSSRDSVDFVLADTSNQTL